MGLLSDIAKTQVLLVVSPGIIAGEWVVDRVYGDGTTEQLYKSTFLPDVDEVEKITWDGMLSRDNRPTVSDCDHPSPEASRYGP